MEGELHRLIYLAKNLKAFYLPGGDPGRVEMEMKELSGRFRYRRVGVLPGAAEMTLRPPFVEINLPPPFKLRGLEEAASSTLALSSLFMTPVISSPEWRDLITPLMLYRISLQRRLTRREFQFNLRLLTYIPVDFSQRNLKRRRREEIIEDCEKRFWRFREECGGGEVRLGVIDTGEYAEEGTPEWMLNPVGVIFLE